MRCPPPERLAAAAAGEDPAAAAHAEACPACRRLLDEQRGLRALLGAAPPPPLARARRAELAAEVLARAGELPLRRRSRRAVIASFAAVAAAAAAVLGLALRERAFGPRAAEPAVAGGPAVPTTPATAPDPPGLPGASAPAAGVAPAVRPPDSAPERPPPPEAPDRAMAARSPGGAAAATVVASAPDAPARFTRATSAGRDVVDLVDGAITIEARATAPVDVVAPRPEGAPAPAGAPAGVRVVRGRVAVVASHGVIRSVTVFAGSAEVTSGGVRHVIEAGTVWDSARDGAIGAAPPGEAALAAFREGWTALREGRYEAALAAFDRATDPVIAEDASYWGAIAAERAGDHAAAARRLDDFLARFPRSPRAEAARLARAQLQR